MPGNGEKERGPSRSGLEPKSVSEVGKTKNHGVVQTGWTRHGPMHEAGDGRCRVEYFWNMQCSRELVVGLAERRLAGWRNMMGKQVLGGREKNEFESQVWRGLKSF
jgi:hypothetical protein